VCIYAFKTSATIASIAMTRPDPNASKQLKFRRAAVSRWNNEGGTGPGGRIPADSLVPRAAAQVPPLTNAELVQLQVRVIALERIAIALLAQSSEEQLRLIRDMAAYIFPRAGRTRHHRTIGAATQMINLVEEAAQFRVRPVRSRREKPPREGSGND